MIHFRCQWCQRELSAEAAHAGQAVNCPGCKGRVVVPQPGEQPPGPPHLPSSPYAEEPAGALARLAGWVRERFVIQLLFVLVPGLVLIGLGLGLELPVLVLVAALLGSLVSLVGWVWFLIVAFSDSVSQGLLCLFVPCYSLFYLLQNFDEAKRPFFVWLVGFSLTAVAQLAAPSFNLL